MNNFSEIIAMNKKVQQEAALIAEFRETAQAEAIMNEDKTFHLVNLSIQNGSKKDLETLRKNIVKDTQSEIETIRQWFTSIK